MYTAWLSAFQKLWLLDIFALVLTIIKMTSASMKGWHASKCSCYVRCCHGYLLPWDVASRAPAVTSTAWRRTDAGTGPRCCRSLTEIRHKLTTCTSSHAQNNSSNDCVVACLCRLVAQNVDIPWDSGWNAASSERATSADCPASCENQVIVCPCSHWF